MKMIKFYFKEAAKSIVRAKTSFLLSLISTTIAIVLIMITIGLYNTGINLKRNISDNLIINVFLQDSIKNEDFTYLKYKLSTDNNIKNYKYIDKENAAKKFIKETGEDFRKILSYNPLPASFSVTLKEESLDPNKLNSFIAHMKKINGVDEVVYQSELTGKIISSINTINKYILVITLVLLFISIYIVYSTIKLIINLKTDEIETMKLVGASLATIKLPIILNGVIIGLAAGCLSYLFFFMVDYFMFNELGVFTTSILRNNYSLLLMFILGPGLCIPVSLFALKNIRLEI